MPVKYSPSEKYSLFKRSIHCYLMYTKIYKFIIYTLAKKGYLPIVIIPVLCNLSTTKNLLLSVIINIYFILVF